MDGRKKKNSNKTIILMTEILLYLIAYFLSEYILAIY